MGERVAIWWTRNMDKATCAEPIFAASSSSSSNVEARLVEDTGSDRFDTAKQIKKAIKRSESFVESACSQTSYIIQKVSSETTATTKLHCPLP